MNRVIEEIAAERQRQVEAEGWSPGHDDYHRHGEIAMAAACYAAPKPIRVEDSRVPAIFNDAWPWDDKWDKRQKHDRRRQLVIAGALIVAEIERLDRAEDRNWGRSKPEPLNLPNICQFGRCKVRLPKGVLLCDQHE